MIKDLRRVNCCGEWLVSDCVRVKNGGEGEEAEEYGNDVERVMDVMCL